MKNNIAIILSIVGTGTGSFGAYTAYQADLFRQPLDKHTQVALSFKDEITSAEKRGDKPKVKTLRIKYEQYEESWRINQLLESITASIRTLDFGELSEEKTAEISKTLNKVTGSHAYTISSPATLGAAFYAVGDFKEASQQLGVALASNPDNNNIRALQAASLISAANTTDNNAASLRIQAIDLVDVKGLKLTNKQRLFLLNTNDDSIRMALE